VEVRLLSGKTKNPIELEVDGHGLTQLCEAAEVFTAYFKSAFKNHRKRDFSSDFRLIPYLQHLSVTQTRSSSLKSVFSGSKYFPLLLETAGLRVLNRKFSDCTLFNVDFIKSKLLFRWICFDRKCHRP
jgi:hypothetical protein